MRKEPDVDTIYAQEDLDFTGPDVFVEGGNIAAFHRAWKELAPALHRIPKVNGRRVEGTNVKALLFMLLSPDAEESARAAERLTTGLRHALELVAKHPSCENDCEVAESPSLMIPNFLDMLEPWLKMAPAPRKASAVSPQADPPKKPGSRAKRRQVVTYWDKLPDGTRMKRSVCYFREDIEGVIKMLKKEDITTVARRLNISPTMIGEIIRGKLKPEDRPYRRDVPPAAT